MAGSYLGRRRAGAGWRRRASAAWFVAGSVPGESAMTSASRSAAAEKQWQVKQAVRGSTRVRQRKHVKGRHRPGIPGRFHFFLTVAGAAVANGTVFADASCSVPVPAGTSCSVPASTGASSCSVPASAGASCWIPASASAGTVCGGH